MVWLSVQWIVVIPTKLITNSKPMATKITMASSLSDQKAKAELVNERADNNKYLKLPNSEDWSEIVSILTDAGISPSDSILMEQFSDEDCEGLQLDYITIFELFGDLRANTDKGYVYLPDELKDEDDIEALIDILSDGLA